MGFSRQEYWSGLPCLPSGGSSQPRDQAHVSCIASGFFAAEPLGKHPLLPIQFSIFSRLSSEQAGAWPKSHLGPRCHLNSTTFPREVCWYSFFTSREIHLWPGCSFFFFGHKTTWLAGSWFPNQGWNLGPLKWKPGSLIHWISKEFPWVLFFSLFKYLLIYLAAPGLVTCGILVPWPEIEPKPPCIGSLSHWITREVLQVLFFNSFSFLGHINKRGSFFHTSTDFWRPKQLPTQENSRRAKSPTVTQQVQGYSKNKFWGGGRERKKEVISC